MNGYPADERQVVDRADRVSLAAGVVANFDLYNRQAKVPRRDGTARPRERQYRKARCSRNSFGTQARPQPFRLDKKLRPLLFVADATLTPGSTADRHQRAFRSAKADPSAFVFCVTAAHVRSETIDGATDRSIVQPLAIRILGLDFLGGRVQPLVVLPKSRLLPSEFDALLDIQFAVRILGFDEIPADEISPQAMGEDLAVEIEDGDVKIPIVKPSSPV